MWTKNSSCVPLQYDCCWEIVLLQWMNASQGHWMNISLIRHLTSKWYLSCALLTLQVNRWLIETSKWQFTLIILDWYGTILIIWCMRMIAWWSVFCVHVYAHIIAGKLTICFQRHQAICSYQGYLHKIHILMLKRKFFSVAVSCG